MWVIEHRNLWGASSEFDMVLTGGNVDEGRWSSRHLAEVYMAWLQKFWARDFRVAKVYGPEQA